MKDNSIINAVKRLERTGDENSRVTEKLHEACKELAGFIEKHAPLNVLLPRDYKVVEKITNVGGADFLVKIKEDDEGYKYYDYVDGINGYLHGDFNCWIPGTSRSMCLEFAQDVAEGWLNEVNEFLEKRNSVTTESISVIENAITDINN